MAQLTTAKPRNSPRRQPNTSARATGRPPPASGPPSPRSMRRLPSPVRSSEPRLAAPTPKPPPHSAAVKPPVPVTQPPATENTGRSVSFADRQNSDTPSRLVPGATTRVTTGGLLLRDVTTRQANSGHGLVHAARWRFRGGSDHRTPGAAEPSQ